MLEKLEISTGENPAASVIWMHGLGADNNDFAPIVDQLNLAGCLPIRFVFPNAPMIPVTINAGHVMRAWYDILGTDFSLRNEDEAGIRASQVAIEELIANEVLRNIPACKIVLAGFSQGSVMSFQTGLRYPEKLAGMICLSGYLPLPQYVYAERHSTNLKTPIFMTHGTMDPVIPIAAAEKSRDFLQQAGHPIEWHSYPMPHGVCAEEINDIGRWLQRIFA